MAKKIVGGIALALALGAMILGIVWLSTNWDNLTAGTGIYTESDLEEKYNEGLQDGLERGEEWRVLVNEYLKQIQELENELNQDKEELAMLKLELRDEKLNNTDLQEQVNSLKAQIQEKDNKIKYLELEIQTLESLLEDKPTEPEETHTFTFTIGQSSVDIEINNDEKWDGNLDSLEVPSSFNITSWTIGSYNAVDFGNAQHYSIEDIQDIETNEDMNFYAEGQRELTFYSISEEDFEQKNVLNAVKLQSAWYDMATYNYNIIEFKMPYSFMSLADIYTEDFSSLSKVSRVGGLYSSNVYVVDKKMVGEDTRNYFKNSQGIGIGTSVYGWSQTNYWNEYMTDYSNVDSFGFESITITTDSDYSCIFDFSSLTKKLDSTYSPYFEYSGKLIFTNGEETKECMGTIGFEVVQYYEFFISIDMELDEGVIIEINKPYVDYNMAECLLLINTVVI